MLLSNFSGPLSWEYIQDEEGYRSSVRCHTMIAMPRCFELHSAIADILNTTVDSSGSGIVVSL